MLPFGSYVAQLCHGDTTSPTYAPTNTRPDGEIPMLGQIDSAGVTAGGVSPLPAYPTGVRGTSTPGRCTGAAQCTPSLDVVYTTTSRPFSSCVQATYRVPSGAIAPAGKLFTRNAVSC